MTQQIIREAKSVAERAMSLSANVADRHATTYYIEQGINGIDLIDVKKLFRQAFAEREAEMVELDSFVEEEE